MTKQTKAATKPEWGTQTSHLLVHQWNIIMEHNATSVRRIPAFVTRQQTVAATRLSLKKNRLGKSAPVRFPLKHDTVITQANATTRDSPPQPPAWHNKDVTSTRLGNSHKYNREYAISPNQ